MAWIESLNKLAKNLQELERVTIEGWKKSQKRFVQISSKTLEINCSKSERWEAYLLTINTAKIVQFFNTLQIISSFLYFSSHI